MANVLLSLIVLGSMMTPQADDLKEVISKEHALSWKVPKTWSVKQGKNQLTLTIPVGTSTAKLNIFATYYRRPAEEWQKLQGAIAEQLGRKLDQQWEEQVLGVPLLLTKTSSSSGVRITGLLYATMKNKFHFTLDAPSMAAEDAWSSWKSAMETLRPLGGELPTAEDGQKPVTSPTLPKPGDKPVHLGDATVSREVKFGPQKVEFTAANRTVTLRTDKEWSINQTEGEYWLSAAKLANKAKFTVLSELDSPEAPVAMKVWADKNLERFTSVALRANTGPKRNLAGANVWSVLRRGEAAGGPLITYCSIGSAGGYYWVLEYECTDAKTWAADQKLLEKFALSAGFEVAP